MNSYTKRLHLLKDDYLQNIKNQWFAGNHPQTSTQQYIKQANDWFRSSKRNDLQGWDSLPYIDITLGCTHFIESLLIRYKNLQVLSNDYAYYSLIGMPGVTDPDELVADAPLIISLPNWKYADLRPNWDDILKICEQRAIDIHIDMAWAIAAKNIEIDLSHPCIKSIAMSLSKYSMQWNRVGLRWTKQRTMDSITMFNHYQGDVNLGPISCGSYIMKNLSIDYGWNTYEKQHYEVCKEHGLTPSKIFYVAHEPITQHPVSISRLLCLTN